MNNHHIYPRSRTEKSSHNLNCNQVVLSEKVHVDLHRLFSNKIPLEQIETILNINIKALQHWFISDIYTLLNDWEWHEMKDWILLRKDKKIVWIT